MIILNLKDVSFILGLESLVIMSDFRKNSLASNTSSLCYVQSDKDNGMQWQWILNNDIYKYEFQNYNLI